MSRDLEPSTPGSSTSDSCTLHWTEPSKLYAGSVVPRWEKQGNRTQALIRAHELIHLGVTDRVVMRSVEVIT